MSYLVLARKYRPRQFTELVGQQHVATTMLNAFRQNKIGQAYLFTGTRGVGKTSVARIFAKALRCEDPEARPGGKNRGQSCDKCPSCLEINSGNSMDVLEIDGASNNGVDNVREIREQVKFLPSRGTMKVYIIDEVHMLSNAAFNALLKTLEEPPPHVTFIFATTEVQKIPPTILSRCQRFDFKRVPQPLILEHLHKLIQLEGMKAEPGALRLIAKKAEGSVRDALSSLDQCLAFSGKDLTVKGVTDSLGIVSGTFLLGILSHVFQKEVVKAAEMVNEAFLQGVEMKEIAIGLADTLRNALFVKYRATSSLAEVSEEEKKEYEAFVKNISPETLQAGYRLTILAVEEILRSPLPKASLEMALARLAGIGHLQSLENFLTAAPSMTAVTPAAIAEKKSPEPAITAASAAPSSTKIATADVSTPKSFLAFVQFVLQQNSALGALLEHAIPVSTEENWAQLPAIHIGFRKNHNFYQMQALHKPNFEVLERLLSAYLSKKVPLKIETVADSNATHPQVSMVEKETKATALTTEAQKKRFMEHEIVRNTKEIFGAELTSFDIDKTK